MGGSGGDVSENLFRSIPMRQIVKHIGPEDQEEFRFRERLAEMANRVQGEARFGTIDFEATHFELFTSAGGQLQHGGTVVAGGNSPGSFVGGDPRRDENQPIQRERLPTLLGQKEMSQVDRVETAAENTYPHGGLRQSNGGRMSFF